MKTVAILLLALLSAELVRAADPVYLPNLLSNASGTDNGGKKSLDVHVSGGTLVTTEGATGTEGGALPTDRKVIAGTDGSVTRTVKVDSSGDLQVDVLSTVLPSGAATESSLSAINGKLNSLGAKFSSASVPVVLASDHAAVPASQSGTWNIGNVTGTVSLPTGASSEATLSALNDKAVANFGTATAGIRVNAQIGNSSGAASFGTGTAGAQTLRVVLPTDQTAVPANLQDGSGNAVTSGAVGSNRGLYTRQLGYTVVGTARNDYGTGSVTTGAWTQLVASTSAEAHELEIFDSSGQTLELGTGAAASEARLLLVTPGGNGRVRVRVASGTRLSIRAVSANADAGEIDLNLYGL